MLEGWVNENAFNIYFSRRVNSKSLRDLSLLSSFLYREPYYSDGFLGLLIVDDTLDTSDDRPFGNPGGNSTGGGSGGMGGIILIILGISTPWLGRCPWFGIHALLVVLNASTMVSTLFTWLPFSTWLLLTITMPPPPPPPAGGTCFGGLIWLGLGPTLVSETYPLPGTEADPAASSKFDVDVFTETPIEVLKSTAPTRRSAARSQCIVDGDVAGNNTG